ncbi:xanthine phosphoribosyltransferase [Apilactobacillus xinyiensis]|uniref:xanthine phosphoribosyltransferase n=1 Tax=Apilactobacillus xinyiensis TaxID=2841032 RepID=UPI00200F5126|nr:xanthine phosphoribosyltransferase [Apilactobacillus xinyiensis]MCL0319148.1 xanthine phosphoribosyltransferase [Apilactobacillus xinyiensis]
MKLLEDRIVKDGTVLSGDILKVDTFLNHQVDPQLMNLIGKEFKKLFDKNNITRILTVESSGIAPAVLTGLQMNVPVVFARKHKSVTMSDNAFVSDVYSYTKKVTNHISIDKRFINSDDNVLIIDDFLANGQAVHGLVDIIHQAKANVSGIGIVIEKSFQPGRKQLEKDGFNVKSLARIASLDNNKVAFVE